jgi:hypothetical protein
MSISQSQTNSIKNIVNELVKKGTSFTAHDITLIMRGSGNDVTHNSVKPVVHDYMQSVGKYSSKLRTFGLAVFGTLVAIRAIVYGPTSTDIANYDPNSIRNILANNQAPVTSNTNQPTTSSARGTKTTNTQNKGVIKVGSGGRVRVPTKYVNALGVNWQGKEVGPYVYYSKTSDGFIVAKNDQGQGWKSITVDQYGNVLLRTNLNVSNFTIEQVGSDKIEIRASQ